MGAGPRRAGDSACIGSVFVGHMSLIGALAIEYFLADGGESCSAACAKVSPVALACDLRAITAAAASVATCSAVLSELGMNFTISAMYPDDDSGCTYHPGQTGWAQLMHSGLSSGAPPAPTCDEVNADPGRRRHLEIRPEGAGKIEGYTVLHDRANQPTHAIAACVLPNSARAWARLNEPGDLAAMLAVDPIGQRVCFDGTHRLEG